MLTPLHDAVIAGNEKEVARLLTKGADVLSTDPFGFIPEDLAKLLGKLNCQKLFGHQPITSILLQRKGESELSTLPLASFESLFKISYREFPYFSSYEELGVVVNNCPYILRSAWIAKQNHEQGRFYKKQLNTGSSANLAVKWIDPVLEYGLFANEDLPAGAYVGEYTGLVRRLFRRQPDYNVYCFQYPTKLWSWNYYVVDALNEGNLLRFANHSDEPNMQPHWVVDRGLLHMLFTTKRKVMKGTQLTFDYGQDFWHKKHFTG